MSLQNAAVKALDETNALLTAIQAAERDLLAAKSTVDGQRQGFDASWQPLLEAAYDLLEKSRRLHGQMVDESRQRLSELAELRSRADAAHVEMERGIARTQGGLERFTARAWDLEPELRAAVERASEKGESLRLRAAKLQRRLRDATREAAGCLNGEVATDIEQLQKDVERRVQLFEEYVAEECVPKLRDRAVALQSRLGALPGSLQGRLGDLGDKVQGRARETAAECLERNRKVLDRIARLGESAASSMERLGRAAAGGTTGIGESRNAVESGIEGTRAGLQKAIRSLDGVLKLLRTYTFIPL